MLLQMAGAALPHHDVSVIGPSEPRELAQGCAANGIGYLPVTAKSRRNYAWQLSRELARCSSTLIWCNGALPAAAALSSRSPFVAHLHQIPSTKQRLLLAPSRRRALFTLAPSEFAASRIDGARPLLNWTEPLDVLPPRRQGQDHVVGYLGRLSTHKGVDTLADAVAILLAQEFRVSLTVAGDSRFVRSSESVPVERALARLPPSTIDRLGWVSPAEFFRGIDVCVVPSRWAESFGLVAAEAMGYGIPVLVSDAGALPEVVGAGHPWVFKAGDTRALAGVLKDALQASAPHRREVVSRARARWELAFSPEQGEHRFLEILGESLGSVGQPG